jgi:hypothetical protein
MPDLRPAAALLAACLALAGCGDLPRPFAGRPGLRAMELSVPPPPRLVVPPPSDGLLPAHDARAWAHETSDALVAQEVPAFDGAPHPGDWVLRLAASLHGITVQPRYSLIDPKGADRGDVDGVPVPAAVWAQGGLVALRQNAADAAPQVLALLRAVDATMKQSDPNSLYNRPARIFFAGVTGAPGDGDATLARGMRIKLPQTGDQLVARGKPADFVLRATVKVSDEPGGQQQVEIHWLVSDPAGRLAGDVAQGHDIPRGTLDHYWGDVADVVTEEAAGGVHEVITNFSGRSKDGRGAAPNRAGAGGARTPPITGS